MIRFKSNHFSDQTIQSKLATYNLSHSELTEVVPAEVSGTAQQILNFPTCAVTLSNEIIIKAFKKNLFFLLNNFFNNRHVQGWYRHGTICALLIAFHSHFFCSVNLAGSMQSEEVSFRQRRIGQCYCCRQRIGQCYYYWCCRCAARSENVGRNATANEQRLRWSASESELHKMHVFKKILH